MAGIVATPASARTGIRKAWMRAVQVLASQAMLHLPVAPRSGARTRAAPGTTQRSRLAKQFPLHKCPKLLQLRGLSCGELLWRRIDETKRSDRLPRRALQTNARQ